MTAALAERMHKRPRELYAQLLSAVSRLSAAQHARGVAADAVVRALLRAIIAHRPHLRHRVRADAQLLTLAACLPLDRTMEALIAATLRSRVAERNP